jgi:hypothetical protein
MCEFSVTMLMVLSNKRWLTGFMWILSFVCIVTLLKTFSNLFKRSVSERVFWLSLFPCTNDDLSDHTIRKLNFNLRQLYKEKQNIQKQTNSFNKKQNFLNSIYNKYLASTCSVQGNFKMVVTFGWFPSHPDIISKSGITNNNPRFT